MKLIASTILLLSLFSCVFAQEARKIEEFDDSYCESYLARMDGIINIMMNDTSSRIYFLVYEGKEFIYSRKINKMILVSSARNSTKAKIISIKKYLRKYLRNEKTVYLEARFRKNSIVEVWLVPSGATPPKPTPTLTKMKYRKGKSKGFCLDSGA